MERTDQGMLISLLDDDRLEERERDAFSDMLTKLQKGIIETLSIPQRQWVEDYYRKLEKVDEEGSLNLWSNKKVPIGIKTSEHHFESMARPEKPPGVKKEEDE